jgi:hypothetical protein
MYQKTLVAVALAASASLSLAQQEVSLNVNLNALNAADYEQISAQEYRYEDQQKSVLVSYGLTGLNNHINYLDAQIKQLQKDDLLWTKDDVKLDQLLLDYEMMLNKRASLTQKTAEISNRSEPNFGSRCYPSLNQDYDFTFNIMHAVGLSVESHYPLVPGPYPPIQQTTIRSRAFLSATDGYGGLIEDLSTSQFIGTNISSGTTTANSLVYPINPFSATVNWQASSFMIQSSCFESIIASGTL